MEHSIPSAPPTESAFTSTAGPAATGPEDRSLGAVPPGMWAVQVCPTTGGHFSVHVAPEDCVEGLKRAISKRLKIAKERISLLYRERLLKEGTLKDNGVFDGCKITLLPNVESGLVSQRPEHTVMQALENLSDNQQVNEFLTGRTPLTLAMRLGDHMVFVQLQLSTAPPSSKRLSSTASPKSRSAKSAPKRTVTPARPVPVMMKPAQSPAPISSVAPLPIATTAPPTNSTINNNNNTVNSTVKSNSAKPVNLESVPILDSSALAEASRNLQQKLKELSHVSTTHINEAH